MERRLTKQRQLIYDITMTMYHPNAEEVFKKVHEKYPEIGRATVYRNLTVLVEQGLLTKLVITGESIRYDINIKHHNHFVCTKCGKIIDLPEVEIVKVPDNLDVEYQSVTFYGVCPECKQKIDTK